MIHEMSTETRNPDFPTGQAADEPSPTTDPSASIPSQDDLAALRAKAAKADEHWDRYLRQVAEFDNFKKRAARERLDAIRYANEAMLEKLIPLLDNFEMAAAAAHQPQNTSIEAIRTGISMILSQLKAVVAEGGLEEIQAAGLPFDPNFHEAVSEQASSSVPEGHVLTQLRKGYKLKDRLVRPAAVIVAKKADA